MAVPTETCPICGEHDVQRVSGDTRSGILRVRHGDGRECAESAAVVVERLEAHAAARSRSPG